VLLIKSFCPSLFSNTLIDWLTADCDINSSLDASEKLNVFAT